MNSFSKNILWVIVIFLLSYLAIFYNLDKPSIFIYDEAVYANNALDMSIDKDFLVLHSSGEPTLYNVKPPLVIWMQCVLIWLLGAGELAIRLPSALATFGTCLILFFFARRWLSKRIGLMAVLSFVTTRGIIRDHVARSGDLDAVLVFLIAAYTFLSFHFLLKEGQATRKYLIGMALLVTAAFLCKSLAGFMPLLGLLLAALVVGRAKFFFRLPHILIATVSIALVFVTYYAVREYLLPGYISVVWYSEYSRFTQNIMPWHEHPFWYYLETMYNRFYKGYIWLLLLSPILWLRSNTIQSQIATLAIVFAVIYMLVISIPAVKLDWYQAPVYPCLSLLIAMILNQILEYILPLIKSSKMKSVLAVCFVAAVFSYPYYLIYRQNLNYHPISPFEREGFAMRAMHRSMPQHDRYKVFMPLITHEAHLLAAQFYARAYSPADTAQIQVVNGYESLKAGDSVLLAQVEVLPQIQERFKTTLLAEVEGAQLIELQNR